MIASSVKLKQIFFYRSCEVDLFLKYFLLQGKGRMLAYWLTGFMETLTGNKEHSVILMT